MDAIKCNKKSIPELLENLKNKGLVSKTDEIPLLNLLTHHGKIIKMQQTIINDLKARLKRSG